MTKRCHCSVLTAQPTRVRVTNTVFGAALMGLAAVPASAQTWTGAASNDWTDAANWSGGVPTNGAVTINTTSTSPVIGASGPATTGAISVGTSGGTGNLTIQNGGSLASDTVVSLGGTAGSTGVATVTGAGSTWTMNVPVVSNSFRLGSGGVGTLYVQQGGTVAVTGGTSIAFSTGGSGTLNIESGGALTTTTFVHVGGRGEGVATVTGLNSLLDVGTDLVVGLGGNGTLNIQNGAAALAGRTTVASTAASVSALNINSGGTLETSQLVAGAGTPQVNFDAARLRATADEVNFVTGFSGSELNIQTGGLTVDTAGFDVGTDAGSAFSGAGGLTVTGGGTFSLLAANTYAGATTIDAGTTLALSGSGSIANSSRVVADGTFDISAVTPTSANIQSLAGGGTVSLGAKTLTLTNANDTFAGSITGTGGLTVSAGTETLTGISNYTGATNVTGTGHLRLLNGGQITSTSTTLLNGPGATMTVGGTDSLLQTGSLTLGNITSSNATLNVLNGAEVHTGIARIGGANAQMATVNIDGSGSLLDTGGLSIGSDTIATNAFMNVTNGGTVRSSGGNIGGLGTGTGTKSVLISGQGSSWAVTNNLNILGGASMAVLDGGAVTAGASTIGSGGTSTLLVSGAGSSYAVAGDVLVGGFTGSGTGIATLADGGRMSVGGTLTLANNATRTGILNIGGAEGGPATGAGTLDAATLVFGPGTGRVNFNHTDANYVFSTAMSGGGEVNQTGPGRTVLTGANTYTGDTTISAGTLRAGAINTFSAASAHNVLAGGALDLDGFDQTLTSLDNAGTVRTGGAPGTILTVGTYNGSGGVLWVNTALGADSSSTDRLVVQGDTSGSSNLRVTNVGGTGSPTVEGIKVVDVLGASNGAFSLQGDYAFHGEQAVVGGAYAYMLHKGGVNTPGDGDWYLRSALVNSVPAVPAGPIFQPGVALYESYPQILLQLMRMPTLRERVAYNAPHGNPAYGAAYGDEPMRLGGPHRMYDGPVAYGGSGTAWWGRIDGSRVSIEPSASTAGANYSADQMRLQTGFDARLHEDDRGKLMGGITLQQGNSWAKVDSIWGDGKLYTEGHGFGGTLTWYGSDGFYVDSQAQVNFFKTDIKSDLAGLLTSGDDATGYGASIETGKRISVYGPWALTPQLQLAYTRADFSFTDKFGADVSLDDGDSLLGRLGLAMDYRETWDGSGGPTSTRIYGIANLYYEFLDGTPVDVSGTPFLSNTDELWGGVGVGGSYGWGGDSYALYGEVSVNTGLENFGDSYSVDGTGGLRIRW